MQRVITTYEQVKLTATKSGPCGGCGQNASRTKTFTNTVNQWNRNEDGTVKTKAEVAKNVTALIKAWHEEPVFHARCEAT